MGVEPNHAGLVEASRKAGKLDNLRFVSGSLEQLPGCFAGSAASVSILFPWGSLLRAVAAPEPAALERLRRLLASHGTIELVTAIDRNTDGAELARLGLASFSVESMAPGWRAFDFDVDLTALPEDHPYQTTWWRRIRQRGSRGATLLTARPCGPPSGSPPPAAR